MGGDALDTAGIAPGGDPEWDRFAHWPRPRARLALLALLLLLIASALVPIEAGKSKVRTKNFVENIVEAKTSEAKRPRDDDLALYDRAIARIEQGESYYDFIVEEQRRANYPVTPGLAVRLPTLAYLDAWLGAPGQVAAAVLLMLAVLVAWWRRLGEEPGGRKRRILAMSLLFIGASLGLNRYYFALHELWSGMLLALAFGLHRPSFGRHRRGRWYAAFAVAAVALAIREHALPFVMLMAAMAFWHRDWRQGAAWTALAVVFLVLLAWHLQIIAAQVLPGDRASDPWLAMRGLSGWLSNVALSSNLRLLPHWLAGPLLILMVAGWTSWKSPAGLFGTFLYLGYGLAFMIAGRPDNFYWGAMIAPAMFIGLAFAPRAIGSLIGSAFPDPAPEPATAK